MLEEPIKTTKYLKEEWQVRKKVMEAILDILSDGQSHSSKYILDQLNKQGFTVIKRLINSVLFNEARRYVLYDKETFTYRLREVEPEEIDQAATSAYLRSTLEVRSRTIKARVVGRNDEYVFTTSKLTSPAFFETSAKSRTIQVILNENHPLFSSLDNLLDNNSNDSNHEMCEGLVEARKLFELLLVAWSKYENTQPDGPRRFKVEEARLEWGRNARAFLLDELEEDV